MNIIILLLKKCAPSVIKLTCSAITIVIIVLRKQIFSTSSKTINVILAIICFLLCFLCVYFIYSSVVEIFNCFEKQHIEKKFLNANHKEIVKVSINDICALIEQNEIIDIVIYNKAKRILIGSSSNCKAGSSIFFDKKYYINDTEYSNIDDFRDLIRNYSTNDCLSVAFIDGLNPGVYGFQNNTQNTGDGSLSDD